MITPHESWRTWREILQAFQDGGESVYENIHLKNDPLLAAESIRYLTGLFGTGSLMALSVGDPDYPQLSKLWNTYSTWGMNNPDCVFLYSAIRADATYRIHGQRGSVKLLDIQTGDSHMTSLPNYRIRSNASNFKSEADGSIEIVLSATPHDGNWIPLETGMAWILVRQYFSDWENEKPSDLVIERVGATYPPPLPTLEMLAPRIAHLVQWLRHGPVALQAIADTFSKIAPDSVTFAADPFGMAGMYNGKGHFECEPDQAVILEVEPPSCEYWSFQLTNLRWESLDWHLRQTSLNHHQSTLDHDGVFRAVIAHSDPGVPNWLDPAGHRKGLIGGRYLRADSNPPATLRTVPLRAIRDYLPAETRTVAPSQRSDALYRRMLGAHLRFRQ